MHGTSRPVDPHTGRPRDFDVDPSHLDLPPRRPPQSSFAGHEGVPMWLRVLNGTGWLVALVVFLFLCVLISALPNRALGDQLSLGLAALIIGSVIGLGLHVFALVKSRSAHNHHVALWAGDLDKDYRGAVERWIASRPLIRVARSSNPDAALRQVMQERQASLALGVLPDTQELATASRQSSVLVLAPSQMGKTTCLAAPMLDAHYGPAVVTSVKKDLVDWTAAVRLTRGRVWIFDPSGDWDDAKPIGASIAHWTPLWNVRSWDDAQLMAASMIKATAVGKGENGVHWTESAEMCLAPLLLAAACHTDLTMSDVLDWIMTRLWDTPTAVLEYVRDTPGHPLHHDARLALRELVAMSKTQGDQRDGILQTVVTVVRAYNSKSLDLNAHRQNFDPAAFVRSTDTLYISSESAKQAKLAPVIVALIDAIQQAAYARDKLEPFHSSERPSLLMCLDEAANTAPMRELPRYLSEAGGQGVQMVVILQSLGQAAKVWPAEAKAFLDYFATIVAFGGLSDDATIEALSVLAGDYDRQYVSNTFSKMTSKGFSYSTSTSFLNPTTHTSGLNKGESHSAGSSHSTHKERRLSKGDIASLPPRHALVIAKHERASRIGNFSILELTPCYESPWTLVAARGNAMLPRGYHEDSVDWEHLDSKRPMKKLPPVEDVVEIFRSGGVAAAAAAASSQEEEAEPDTRNWRFE